MAGVAIQEIFNNEYAVLIEEENIEWLVNLGATSHICNRKQMFSQLEPLSFPKRFNTASGNVAISNLGGKVTKKLTTFCRLYV
jgi:hypothetical protein